MAPLDYTRDRHLEMEAALFECFAPEARVQLGVRRPGETWHALSPLCERQTAGMRGGVAYVYAYDKGDQWQKAVEGFKQMQAAGPPRPTSSRTKSLISEYDTGEQWAEESHTFSRVPVAPSAVMSWRTYIYVIMVMGHVRAPALLYRFTASQLAEEAGKSANASAAAWPMSASLVVRNLEDVKKPMPPSLSHACMICCIHAHAYACVRMPMHAYACHSLVMQKSFRRSYAVVPCCAHRQSPWQ